MNITACVRINDTLYLYELKKTSDLFWKQKTKNGLATIISEYIRGGRFFREFETANCYFTWPNTYVCEYLPFFNGHLSSNLTLEHLLLKN